MYMPARFLIIALLAVGVSLTAVIGQQPATVNIRPRVPNTQPGVPVVHVTVDRNRVPLGDEVTFTLAPAGVVTDRRFTVTIFFGDGQQQEMHQTQIVHLYRAPGNYTYSVLVKPSPTPPLPVLTVKLDVNPTTVATGGSVTFMAQLSRSYPDIKYRFVFADGSQTGWQDAPRTSHSYAAAKTYLAYVDIGEGSGGFVKSVGGSPRQPITVTATQTFRVGPSPKPSPSPSSSPRSLPRPSQKPSPAPGASPSPSSSRPMPSPSPSASSPASTTSPGASPSAAATSSSTPDGSRSPSSSVSPTPTSDVAGPFDWPDDWWVYLLFALLVIFLAYKAANYFLFPRPKFVPHIDAGVSRVGAGKPLAIDLQLALDPNITEGRYGIETQEGSLIKSERGSNG